MRLFGAYPRERMDEVVLVLLLLAGIVVSGLPQQEGTRYVRDLAALGNRFVLDTFDWAFHLNYLARENRELRRRVTDLSIQVDHLSEAELQNRRLREMLEFAVGRENEILLGAEVIGWGDGRQTSTITIAAGSVHGVTRNQAVVTADGLAGRIDRSPAPNSAVVSLLNDPSNAVAVVVERTREHGILQFLEGQPRLMDIRATSDIQPGDRLVSSGLGGVYPARLTVGTVRSVRDDPDGVTKQIVVALAADLERLEEVYVLRR